MTMNQIKYFITAGKMLSFSKAAEFLYISQPSLSRQISAIENELNMQLFIRGNRYVRLTPAGTILYKEFSHVYDIYLNALENAQNMNKGLTGSLNIGVLDGTYIGDFMPDMIEKFGNLYPELNVCLYNFSFSGLLSGLYDKSLDIIFTLEFNVESHDNLIYDKLENTKDNIVIHKKHPLYEKEGLSIKDFDNRDLILISADDLSISHSRVLNEYKKECAAPIIRFAPNLQTCMLWVEAGMGAAYLFSRSKLRMNPDLKFFEMNSPWLTSFVISWHRENYNASIPLVSEFCRHKFNNLTCE